MNHFKDENKFGILLSNQYYDKLSQSKRDPAVVNLPAVKDDHMNMRQTMLMAGIPPQNIIELRDASYKDMEDLPDKVKEKIMPLTSDLKDPTGICGE